MSDSKRVKLAKVDEFIKTYRRQLDDEVAKIAPIYFFSKGEDDKSSHHYFLFWANNEDAEQAAKVLRKCVKKDKMTAHNILIFLAELMNSVVTDDNIETIDGQTYESGVKFLTYHGLSEGDVPWHELPVPTSVESYSDVIILRDFGTPIVQL